jgi:hypothetical protein
VIDLLDVGAVYLHGYSVTESFGSVNLIIVICSQRDPHSPHFQDPPPY